MGSSSESAQGASTGPGRAQAIDRRLAVRGTDRRGARRTRATVLGDLLYDGFYSAAVGGAVLGLYFLVVDVAAGQPLFTPALLGTVLFAGTPPESVVGVRLDMAAYFTLVHFGLFGALGTTMAVAVHEWKRLTQHPFEMVAIGFVVLEGGFLLGEGLLMPGVVEVMGIGRITVGNLLTSASMSLFMLKAENPAGWERFKQGRPLS